MSTDKEGPPFAVDLFCGRGGWTKGLLAAGFDVAGYDLDPQPAYPDEATFHQADVRDLRGEDLGGPTVIVASPPCTGFSVANRMHPRENTRRPEPVDFELLAHCLRVIREADPPFFAIENVRGALKWWGPLLGEPRLKSFPLYVWGRFPGFLVAKSGTLKFKGGARGVARNGRPRAKAMPDSAANHRSPALRAEIPAELAAPFGRACMAAIRSGEVAAFA